MEHYQRIAGNFQETIELIAMSVDNLADPIEQASTIVAQALLNDGKILACGNGSDSALAQLFVSNLLGRFEYDRPALPAMSLGSEGALLTGVATSVSVNDLYSRQISALGNPQDVLLCIASGDSHENLTNAVRAAQERNMTVIILSHSDNKSLVELLGSRDIILEVAHVRTPRIVELHTMIIQSLCEMSELSLFGGFQQE